MIFKDKNMTLIPIFFNKINQWRGKVGLVSSIRDSKFVFGEKVGEKSVDNKWTKKTLRIWKSLSQNVLQVLCFVDKLRKHLMDLKIPCQIQSLFLAERLVKNHFTKKSIKNTVMICKTRFDSGVQLLNPSNVYAIYQQNKWARKTFWELKRFFANHQSFLIQFSIATKEFEKLLSLLDLVPSFLQLYQNFIVHWLHN